MNDNAALEGRVTRLENAVTEGFSELKVIVRQEISDLKTEQIADLRKANERLGDDQRRLWDRVSELERRDHERKGSGRLVGSITYFMSAGLGGFATWFATWITATGGKPHP
jgi:hypothetical protein